MHDVPESFHFRGRFPRESARRFAQALFRFSVLSLFLTGWAGLLRANVPGGIIAGGAAVTLTSNGSSATLSNGICSIVCSLSGANLTQINYTYNNGSGTVTTQMLNGGTDGGEWYIGGGEYGGFAGSAPAYSVVVNPATGDTNHGVGNYGEIDLLSTSSTNGTVDIHFSMLRGSPGFYCTAIWSHRSVDAAMGMGETRTNIYAGSIFNWMTVDPGRNKLMEVSDSATSIGVPGAPVECYLWTNGIYQGHYDDKYKYSADFGDQQFGAAGPHRVWGWSSVGTGGLNLGLWDVNATSEYYNAGPMKRELMCHIGTTILNMFNGDHYAEGIDTNFGAGEIWNKVYGPCFVYCNNVPTTITDPFQASQALYNDALAQGAAEASGTPSTAGAAEGATAWPYGWFVNSNYALAASRGTITGQIVVNDPGNPNASGSNMLVGVVQQPPTTVGVYDFQFWTKPYYFFVNADGNGNFTIPNVIAGTTGTNYTFYAFGPGAEGELMSQNQNGGNPPILYNLPATQFSVPVTGGSTTSLGTITWTPSRVGATVFEIGYPDRTSRKFRHGDDYWVGDIGPSPTSPAPVWTKFLEYPFDFPNGTNYNVGTSRWTTDWNFVQPVVTSTTGIYNSSTGTINFTLPTAPGTGAQGSLYLGLSSNFGDATIITLNGDNLGSPPAGVTVTSTPDANASTGYFSPYSQSDTTIREGINGLFSDERLTFPATLLKSGTNINTITISIRQTGNSSGLGYFANHIMYDYIRLELTGYVPPAPASVTAYQADNSLLLSWPVTPGATSYNILRSTTSGSGYSPLASGVLGPVCGSGINNDTWVDTTAANGTTYYYVVQAVNPTGTSANSAQSAGVAPALGVADSAPAAPTGVTTAAGNGQVGVSWTASPGANFYTVQRSVLYNNGGTILSSAVTTAETYNTLGTITLTNTDTGTSYTDTTPTNGSTYAYSVLATNAAGTSGTSTSVNTIPLAPAPTTAPTLKATPGTEQVILTWNAVPGAVGYLVEQASASGGPYTLVTSITELTYPITGLANGTTYYFIVVANNSGGTSANSNVASATTAPAPPASVVATPGNTQVTLTWSSVAGATGYSIERGTVTGGPYSPVGTSVGPSYVDSSLANGTPYYYVVASSNGAGTGTVSTQATATPSASLPLAPTGLTATGTNGDILLAWNATAGATSYVALRSTTTGGPYTQIARSLTSPAYTDASALSGPTYYYVVAAINATGQGAYSNQAHASLEGPTGLLWSGSASSAWDFSTGNWISTSGTGGALVYADGDNVIFPDTASASVVSIAAAVSPNLVEFTNSTLDYTINSSGPGISGGTGVLMAGGGSVTLTGTESYTGGTTISSGTYACGADSSEDATTVESPGLTGGTNASLGSISSGVLVNQGAQLRFGGHGSAVETYIIPNPITINGGSIYGADGLQEFVGGLTIGDEGASLLPTYSTKNLRIHCALSGSGDLTIDDWDAPSDTAGGLVLVDIADNPYSGVITINAPSTGFLGGVLEIGATNSLINATIVDNNTTGGLTFTGITTPALGALAGSGNIALSTGGGHGGTSYTVSAGANGASTTYSGVFSGSGGFIKTGSGTMILSGSNTYTGATTVSGGILEITGAIADSKSLSVASGAVLYIDGGTLNIKGAITNSGLVKLSGAGVLSLTGAFTNNGVLDLINGSQTLPADFINNGTVLNTSSVQAQQVAMSGSNFTLTIQGYPQHTYQLQSTSSLTAPVTWTNLGASQVGTGVPLVFTDTGASSTEGFYQILVSP